MSDIPIKITVDTKDVSRAARGAKKEFTRLEDKSRKSGDKIGKNLSTGFDTLKTSIGALITGALVRQTALLVDTYTLVNNKLKNVTDSAQELAYVQENLYRISQDTRSGLSATVSLYQRLAISTDDLGISSERLFKVTQGLQQAFIVSGATAQESSNAVIQLAQGLASGQLRGEEFRAVAEQGVRVMRALSASLGLNIGQLRELAYSGGLTAEVFLDAFEKQLPVINKEFKEFEATLGQSSVMLGNSITKFVGFTAEATGASSAVSKSLRGWSAILDEVTAAYDRYLERRRKYVMSTRVTLELMGTLATFQKGTVLPPGTLEEQFDARNKSAIEAFDSIEKSLVVVTKYDKQIEKINKRYDEQVARLNKVNVAGDEGVKLIARRNELLTRAEAQREGEIAQVHALAAAQKKAAEEMYSGVGPSPDLFFDFMEKQQETLEAVAEQEKSNTLAFKSQLAERKAELYTYYDEVAELEAQRLADSTRASDGATRALQRLAEEGTDGAAQLEEALTSSFSSATSELTDFIVTGKASFSSFADSVIRDLARIAAQRAVAGLVGAAIGAVASAAASGNNTEVVRVSSADAQASRDAAFAPTTKFANGGVVTSPTYFGMSGGRVGEMGEDGPEGIFPLATVGGKLGLQAPKGMGGDVYVTVQNNTQEQATVTKSTDNQGNTNLLVTVGDLVNQNLASGRHDASLSQFFNLRRRGA